MSLLSDLNAACASVRVDEPLSDHTSFAIGGPADYFVEPKTLAELQAIRKLSLKHKRPVFFIGAGSNLLVSDKGIRGLVIHLQGEFKDIAITGDTVIAGAAAWMPTLAKKTAETGLSGAEALIGIPGTVGGGLVMNAGTRDGWIGALVERVEALDESGNIVTLEGKETFGFRYRFSLLSGYWITRAHLRLKASTSTAVLAKIKQIMDYRTKTQPLTVPTCGSVFKNPDTEPAAVLIEKLKLKGLSVGKARISDRHANFIVNEGGAKASDVRALMEQIQKAVGKKFKIHLEPEVKLVGDWS